MGTNPTLPHDSVKHDNDGLYPEVEGLIINDKQVLKAQEANIVKLTDSTTGTAGNTVDDTTASVKDDIASLAAKINAIIDVLDNHGLTADA